MNYSWSDKGRNPCKRILFLFFAYQKMCPEKLNFASGNRRKKKIKF